ncbi:hypothetical protein ACFTAO_01810 [Paenibacillus rhizoplanae]
MGQSILSMKAVQILLVAAVTAVAGEFKINPFDGDIFRIAMGSSAFSTLPAVNEATAVYPHRLCYRAGRAAVPDCHGYGGGKRTDGGAEP